MKGTILVVEDEPDLMLTFRIVLQTAGYVVIKASTGEDALSAIETVVPDAVILDLRLPGIDGWQVLAAIRRVDLFRNTPIVIASANAEAGERLESRATRLCGDAHQAVQRGRVTRHPRQGPGRNRKAPEIRSDRSYGPVSACEATVRTAGEVGHGPQIPKVAGFHSTWPSSANVGMRCASTRRASCNSARASEAPRQ